MRILALDMATRTGWAVSGGPSGVWDLSIRRDESGGMRLVRFESKLREVLFRHPDMPNLCSVDVIVFEAVSVASGRKANLDGVKLASKLQAIVERLVELTGGLECRSYNVQAIKRHAIPQKGKKRDKEAMVEAARQRWPDVEFEDHNQADAKWLLDLAEKELG